MTRYTVNGDGATTLKTESTPGSDADPDGVEKLRHEYTLEGDRLQKLRVTDRSPDFGGSTTTAVYTTSTYRYDDAGNVQRVYSTTGDNGDAILEESPEPTGTALTPADCSGPDTAASKSITRYCYDEFNRQVFSSGSGITDPAVITYDGLDRRDRKTVQQPGAITPSEARDYTYVGSSEQLSADVKTTGTGAVSVTRHQTYDYDSRGDRQGQETRTPVKTRYRPYAKDANGSVVGLEKPDGTIEDNERYDFDPYGELDRKPPAREAGAEAGTTLEVDAEATLSEEARENPFRFEGFYYDSGVKTYDMHARHYRPDTGRFLSRDQYASAAGDQALQADSLTQNRYAFAGGNPTNNIEFDGHDAPHDMWHRRKGIKGARADRAMGGTIDPKRRAPAGSRATPTSKGSFEVRSGKVVRSTAPARVESRPPVVITPDAGDNGLQATYGSYKPNDPSRAGGLVPCGCASGPAMPGQDLRALGEAYGFAFLPELRLGRFGVSGARAAGSAFRKIAGRVGGRATKPGTYRPPRGLPRKKHGDPIPDSPYPHTKWVPERIME